MADKKTERKKKLKEQLSEIRQEGAALETAIQKNRKRKKAEEALQRAREEAEAREQRRKFANPTTTEEADTQLPPLERQLGIDMTEQEIIVKGTLLQKAKLYYTLSDYGSYFGSSASSPDVVRESLRASIITNEDINLLNKCWKEYSFLQKYGERLSYYFKRFQTSYAVLAKLLTLWDSYEQIAKAKTAAYTSFRNNALWVFVKDPQEKKQALSLFVQQCEKMKLEGAALRFDKDSETFSADVDFKDRLPGEPKERSLYSRIQEEVRQTEADLSDFKAFALAVEGFIRGDGTIKSTLHYLPISAQTSIDNAEEERYARYLVNNLSFFRSELNYRRSKGETITPEEEHRAVIPDYYEVEPTPEVYENCLEWINGALG